jgi:hypothetical protein
VISWAVTPASQYSQPGSEASVITTTKQIGVKKGKVPSATIYGGNLNNIMQISF